MPTVTLLPNATTNPGNGWTVTGAASIHAALADSSDASYVRQTGGLYSTFRVAVTPCGLTASQRIRRVRIKARVRAEAAVGLQARTWMPEFDGRPAAVARSIDPFDPSPVSTAVARNGQWRQRVPDGGNPMSVAELDELEIRFELVAKAFVTPDLRVYEASIEVLYANAPTVTVTGPVGTQNVARPELTIDYDQAEGFPLDRVEWRISTINDAGNPAFSPDSWDQWVYAADTFGQDLDHTVLQDLPAGLYVVWVRVADLLDGSPHWSAWATAYLTIAFDASTPPELVAFPEPDFGRCRLELVDTGNLLTEQDADFEDAALGAGTWIGALSNATVARSTASASHGAAALRVTAIAAGDASIFTPYAVRVRPGRTVHIRAQARAVTTARAIHLGFQYLDEAGTPIGTSTASATVNDATGAYTAATKEETVPAGAAFAYPIITVKAAAAGEAHDFDEIKVGKGVLTVFSRGGLELRNRLDAQTSSIESGALPLGWEPRLNCTVARSTTDAADGAASLELTATGAGTVNMAAQTTGKFPVTAGEDYTALGSFHRGATNRQCALGLIWLDANELEVGTTTGEEITSSTSYVPAAVTGTAPAGAVDARLAVFVYGVTGGSEVHRADRFSLSPDPTLLFQPAPPALAASFVVVEYTDTPTQPATWRTLRTGQAIAPDVYGRVVIHDTTCPASAPRSYRGYTLSIDGTAPLAGDRSPVALGQCPVDVFWLRDPDDPSRDVAGLWVLGPLVDSIPERYGSFVPLPVDGEVAKAIVVSGGLSGIEAAYVFQARDDEVWARLEPLIRETKPLLLVSPAGWERWIQIVGNRDVTKPGPAPRRDVAVQTIEVDEPR